MKVNTERGIWRWLGLLAVVAGIAVMVWAFIGVNGAFDWDRVWPRRAAMGAAVALAGVTCLVLSRVLGLFSARGEDHRSSVWTLLTYGAIAVGAIGGFVQAIVWNVSVNQLRQAEWMTALQKCTFVVLGFLFLAGLVALIGQRAVARATEKVSSTAVRERVAHR